jgi:hypothetical protein
MGSIKESLNPENHNKKEKTAMAEKNKTQNWPDLAIGLYDKLTGRGAEISYQFENFEVHVPSSTGAEADHAKWRLNGNLRINTRDNSNQ